MPIREFELFHGAVLTKLVRNDRPVALRMIETRPSESWAYYRINDEVELIIKYRGNPQPQKSEATTSWAFTFNPGEVQKLRSSSVRPFAALVCGGQSVKAAMHVCLLDQQQFHELLSADHRVITVKHEAGKKFRVSSAAVNRDVLVSQNALDKWDVPGS